MLSGTPMTLGEYNSYRGWNIPENENPEEPGYLVEYLDGGKPNHPEHRGYISWSPKDVFERSYRPIAGLSFGDAIKALKIGERVARKGWNGKGMFLVFVHDKDYQLNTIAQNKLVGVRQIPWVGMKTADNCFVPWLASQTDILSEDWEIV